jgi:4-aminobutyrate aminotransferase
MSDKPVHMKHMPHFVGPVAPIVIDHAEGSWVYATDGSRWLDFVVGIAVVNTGHSHPKVVKAVQDQAAKLAHAQMGIYRHSPMLELAEEIVAIAPEGLDEVMYTNSGAEAVENAVKLAKQATRRPGVIAFHGAFHGRTHLTMALTDSAIHYRGHHEPLVPSIYHARYCYPFRTPASEDPTEYALEDLRRVLRSEIYGDDVACIVVEPIQGEGGFIVPTAEFMQQLRAVADEIGACLVVDEIQAGFGRTGVWFCHEHYGITPDIITVAKGIASGYPLGAVVAPKALWDECLPGSMGGTYGGNAVACAAGVATIAAMKEDGTLANAARQGEKLRAFLTGLQADYPVIGEVRGKGLMNAIEVVVAGTKEPNAPVAKAFIAECIKRRLVIMGAGSHGNCVRFLPQLNISDEEMDAAFVVFTEAAAAAFGGAAAVG